MGGISHYSILYVPSEGVLFSSVLSVVFYFDM